MNDNAELRQAPQVMNWDDFFPLEREEGLEAFFKRLRTHENGINQTASLQHGFGGLTCLQLITQAEKIQEKNGFILYRGMATAGLRPKGKGGHKKGSILGRRT